MLSSLQEPDLKAGKNAKIIFEFLTKSPDELANDKNVEGNIEQLLSANYNDTSHDEIYSKIRKVEKRLGNTVKGDYLFRITLADDSRDFNKEWIELFNPKRKRKTLNATTTSFILQRHKLLSGKTKEFHKDMKGFCLSFTNIVDHLKLREKKDFDYLLSLADCNENELSDDNFTKFLRGELYLELLEETNEEKREEKQKLIDMFSLIRYVVEEIAVLQVRSITKDSQFSLKYKKDLPTNHFFDSRYETRLFNPQKIQIVLNRPKTNRILQNLLEGNTIGLTTNGHSVSITKICSSKDSREYHYIVVDSNGSHSVVCGNDKTRSAEDKLCDVIEIISNRYLHSTRDQHIPHIAYNDITKTHKEVRKCFAEKDKDKDGKPYYEAGNLEVVTSLLKRGADVNTKDEDGCPILSIATDMGNPKVVDRLLASKPFVNAQDKDGFTALSHAARKGHLAVIISLVSHNPDINLQDNHGNTPLHWALEKGNKIAVIILIKAGADLSIKNEDGKTALDFAQEYGRQEIVTLLKEKKGASRPPESNVHITGTKEHSS